MAAIIKCIGDHANKHQKSVSFISITNFSRNVVPLSEKYYYFFLITQNTFYVSMASQAPIASLQKYRKVLRLSLFT